MISRPFVITALSLIALIVYLFASAPPPLTEEAPSGVTLPIERVFALAEAENDVARALWTQEIVGAGKKVGLKFNEDWREQGVEAGPLPALFLRETAKSLERDPVQLSLFLGSDFPINEANRFEGMQHEKFQLIKQTREPQFFFMPDTGLHTGMFSDIAVVEPCVTCHNEHKQSPKNDWKLNDVMGATTWMYPKDKVTLDEVLQILTAMRQGFHNAYLAYLAKVETFTKRPEIGDKWPREGYYLPSVEVFMNELDKRASPATLATLAAAIAPEVKQEAAPTPPQVVPAAYTDPPPSAPVAQAAPALQASPKPQGYLVLRTREKCWVEIRDATGKRLVSALLQANTARTLAGHPPFKVRLGNPEGITLEYTGQPIEHLRYPRRGRVQEFLIGQRE